MVDLDLETETVGALLAEDECVAPETLLVTDGVELRVISFDGDADSDTVLTRVALMVSEKVVD